MRSALQLRVPSGRARPAPAGRTHRLSVQARLVLKPTGTGTTEHLDGETWPAPGPIVLRDGAHDVGRLDTCAVSLPIPTVSSRHAILTVEGDRLLVFDTGSTNGTFLDGVEVPPNNYTVVPVGCELTFGDEYLAKFLLVKEEDAAPQ